MTTALFQPPQIFDVIGGAWSASLAAEEAVINGAEEKDYAYSILHLPSLMDLGLVGPKQGVKLRIGDIGMSSEKVGQGREHGFFLSPSFPPHPPKKERYFSRCMFSLGVSMAPDRGDFCVLLSVELVPFFCVVLCLVVAKGDSGRAVCGMYRA